MQYIIFAEYLLESSQERSFCRRPKPHPWTITLHTGWKQLFCVDEYLSFRKMFVSKRKNFLNMETNNNFKGTPPKWRGFFCSTPEITATSNWEFLRGPLKLHFLSMFRNFVCLETNFLLILIYLALQKTTFHPVCSMFMDEKIWSHILD